MWSFLFKRLASNSILFKTDRCHPFYHCIPGDLSDVLLSLTRSVKSENGITEIVRNILSNIVIFQTEKYAM